MGSDEFIKFISENWDLFCEVDVSEPLLLFFILKNLYHRILPGLNEFSMCDDATFNSVISHKTSREPGDVENKHTCTLLSSSNYVLTQPQKDLIRVVSGLSTKHGGRQGYSEWFQIFWSTEPDGRTYLLVSDSHLYHIVEELTSVFINMGSEEDVKDIANEKCLGLFELLKATENEDKIKRLIEEAFRPEGNSRLTRLASGLFLLHINPSFSGVVRTFLKYLDGFSKTELYNTTLMVNSLIRLHPKETNLWEIKSHLTELWFRAFQVRRRSRLVETGCFSTSSDSSTLYKTLIKFIYRLFNDKLLLLDRSFVTEMLLLKPFNNNVPLYLKNQHECVKSYVLGYFRTRLETLAKYTTPVPFSEFTWLRPETRYTILFSNALFRMFYDFYTRLLSKVPSPSVFILLVSLLREREYTKTQLSAISHADLDSSSYLYTRPDEGFEAALRLCDEQIKLDSQNCWIHNKSTLLLHLADLTLLRPFLYHQDLAALVFRFRVAYLFQQHLSTWHAFTDSLASIYLKNSRDARPFRFCRGHGKVEFRGERKRVCELDEYKSESVAIRRFISSGGNYRRTGHVEGYGFVNAKFVHLESLDILQAFSDWEVDNILNAFTQLLQVLLNLFRSIEKFRACLKLDLGMTELGLLFKAIGLLFRYSRLIPRLGTRVSVLVGIRRARTMKRLSGLLTYKYHGLPGGGGSDQYLLESLVARLALLVLSQPFRFCLHWSAGAQARLELLHRQTVKLK